MADSRAPERRAGARTGSSGADVGPMERTRGASSQAKQNTSMTVQSQLEAFIHAEYNALLDEYSEEHEVKLQVGQPAGAFGWRPGSLPCMRHPPSAPPYSSKAQPRQACPPASTIAQIPPTAVYVAGNLADGHPAVCTISAKCLLIEFMYLQPSSLLTHATVLFQAIEKANRTQIERLLKQQHECLARLPFGGGRNIEATPTPANREVIQVWPSRCPPPLFSPNRDHQMG